MSKGEQDVKNLFKGINLLHCATCVLTLELSIRWVKAQGDVQAETSQQYASGKEEMKSKMCSEAIV